jgi:hypothetical protein
LAAISWEVRTLAAPALADGVSRRGVDVVTFRREDRGRVANGEITVTFRLWTSSHVKAGNVYATGFGPIEVEDVQLIPAALVTDDDARAAGCADIPAVWRSAGDHTRTEIQPETLLYRVQFRYCGDPLRDLPVP